MKILQMVHSRNFAGTEQLVLTLSAALKAAGHEVFVAAKNGGVLARRYRDAGLNVIQLPLNAFFIRRRLARWVRDNGIDIVHAHLTEAARIACKLHKDTGVAAVAHLHVMRKAQAYRQMAEIGPLVAISRHTWTYFRDEARLPAERLRLVLNATNAVNAPEAAMPAETLAAKFRKEFQLPPNSRLIAFPGRIAPEKGHETLLRAMPAVLKKHPEAHVLVAGNLAQKKSHVARLEKLKSELGLDANVRFIGIRPDILKLTRAAELQLVLSKREPFGLVLVEAMAMGTPVVGTNTGAIPEILDNGRLGTLVEYGDISALSGAIDSLLSNPRPHLEKAALAQTEARRHYAPGRMAGEIVGIYNELLDNRRPNTPCPP